MVLNREITARIKSVLKANPQGMSITDIVAAVDINRNTTGRYLENLLVSGQVEMRQLGMAKIYTLSQRVPVSAVLSISSELIMQLDKNLRIVFANEPFLSFLSVSSTDLFGKNIEYSRVLPVFEEIYSEFVDRIRSGIAGTEWSGELALKECGIIFSCRIAPTAFDNGQKGVSVILEDITERKRADEALLESEERCHTIINNMQDAYFRADGEGRVIMASPSAARLFKYGSADEMIGISAVSLYRDPELRKEIIRTLTNQGVVQDFICEAMRKDGTSFWVSMNVQFVFDAKGRVAGTDGFVRDITGRKHAEDALRESETRYRSLAEASQDLIFVIGKDETVEYVNSIAAHLIGKRPEGIVGSKRSALFPPPVLDRQNRQLKQIFSTGNPSRSEGRMVIHNETRWFDHFLVPVKDKDGSVQSVLGISRDITDRKKLEERLRGSEQNFRLLAEYSLDIITRMTPKIVCNYVSPAITSLLGYAPHEITGQSIIDYIHPDDVAGVRSELKDIFAGKDARPTQFRIRHKNGDYLSFETVVRVIRDPQTGRVEEFYCVSRDITERKRAEAALVKSEERFRDLINTTADIVWQTDAEKRFVYVSPQVEKILGYTPNELVGRSPFEFLDPVSVKLSQFVFDTAVRTHQNILLHESRWIDRDGNVVVMESHATPVYNSDGTCTGFRGIDRDITDR